MYYEKRERKKQVLLYSIILWNCKHVTICSNFCIYIIWNKDGEPKKKNFFVKLGIFGLELGKKILFGIGNGAEFRPQNLMIESPATGHRLSFPKHIAFLSLKIDFVVANKADPDEMPHHAVCQCTRLPTHLGFLVFKALNICIWIYHGWSLIFLKKAIRVTFGPQCGKICLCGFRPGMAQTSLPSYRDKSEHWNYEWSQFD